MKVIDVSYIFYYPYHSGILTSIKYILKELYTRDSQVTLLIYVDSNFVIEFDNSEELIKIIESPERIKEHLLQKYSTQKCSDFVRKYSSSVSMEFYMLSTVVNSNHALFLKSLKNHFKKSLFTFLIYDLIPEFNSKLFNLNNDSYLPLLYSYNTIVHFDRFVAISDPSCDNFKELFSISPEIIPLGFDHIVHNHNFVKSDFVIAGSSQSKPLSAELESCSRFISRDNSAKPKIVIIGSPFISNYLAELDSYKKSFDISYFDKLESEAFNYQLSSSKILLNLGKEGFSLNAATFLYNGKEVYMNRDHPLWKYTSPGSQEGLRKLSNSAMIPTWSNFCNEFFGLESNL